MVKIIPIWHDRIVEGPKGDCLYLEVKNSNESLGENTLLEKLVPTSCSKSKETFEVVCYTPKNSGKKIHFFSLDTGKLEVFDIPATLKRNS